MIVCGGVESGVQFKLGNVVTAYCKQLWDVGAPIADMGNANDASGFDIALDHVRLIAETQTGEFPVPMKAASLSWKARDCPFWPVVMLVAHRLAVHPRCVH